MKLVIIDYGAGNIKSIQFAFKRLGITAVLSNDEVAIKNADKIIFPGVGEASTAMAKLRDSGLDTLIPTLTQPVLGICLGMQLMCKNNEEGTSKGLGIFNVDVVRFSNAVKVPQIGWNQLSNLSSPLFKGIKEMEYQYFVHSYYVPSTPQQIASCTYEFDYAAALQHENFYGVQFHPEKSGEAGERLLKNFINL
ncbi:MAG: imidazole glycerol phosphate synthase subunit HisH [Flavobacteriaceae bacterium]|nr:MAG: imidazole glycerol phosphate synthase subunit HisH [Flavobacteriaceae bacterium]